jgi:hypothetical protein
MAKKERFAGALEIAQDIDMDAMLSKLAGEMKLKGIESGLKHVGQMVIAEAQQRVPRSSQTGTKKKWSRSYRERYKKSTPLHTQFVLKPKEYRGGKVLAVVVRVKYPQGAHGHLVEFGHRSVLWGRRTGGMVQGKRFMLPAIEASRVRADAAFKSGLEAAIVGAGG